jgi:PhnB protein
MQIGDSVVIIEDEVPEQGSKAPPPGGVAGSPSSLFIYVEDADAVIARAVELGATLKRPPQDRFYGDRDGYVVDPFGHGWTIATHVEDVAPEEMARRTTPVDLSYPAGAGTIELTGFAGAEVRQRRRLPVGP